jgi:hypothetical protein
MTEKEMLDETSDDPEKASSFLSSKWQEVFRAIEIYHNYVKHTTTVLFGVITGIGAIRAFF